LYSHYIQYQKNQGKVNIFSSFLIIHPPINLLLFDIESIANTSIQGLFLLIRSEIILFLSQTSLIYVLTGTKMAAKHPIECKNDHNSGNYPHD